MSSCCPASQLTELYTAAHAAGVAVEYVRSSMVETSVDKQIISSSHRVEGVGDYRQLAEFFDRIYSVRGLAGIERLAIEPKHDAGPGVLRATMRVTWYAPGPGVEDEDEGVAQ